ncbi:MAG: hypothetical protein HY788_19730 [Deltaproteobacteria bacterium]|nr:hypothetical protein [Deltaproteobacteria bacterium]
MKYFTILISLISLFLQIQSVHGAVYQSDLGYSIDVPEGWTIFSKGNAREKPQIIEAAMNRAKGDEGLSAIPSNVLNRVKELLMGEKIDYYQSGEPRFTISVYKGTGELPVSSDKVEAFCKSLAEDFDKQGDNGIKLHECSIKQIDGRRAVYLIADDYWKNKKYIQYQIQKGQDEILFVTANSMEKPFSEMSNEFDTIIHSLETE